MSADLRRFHAGADSSDCPGRMAVESVAECAWIRWPNGGGITGQMLVEQVAEWRGIRTMARYAQIVGLLITPHGDS